MKSKLSVLVQVPALQTNSDILFPPDMRISDGILLTARLVAEEAGVVPDESAHLRLFSLDRQKFLPGDRTFAEVGTVNGEHLLLL